MGKFLIPREELIYAFSRSSGAGGQNVNKVNSKAEVRWDISSSQHMPRDVFLRFMARYKNRCDAAGWVISVSEKHRDRERNIEDAIHKLEEWVDSVWEKPKARIKTKPTRGSKKRRLESKRKVADKKHSRSKKSISRDW